jgi:phosphate transport system protein
MNNTQPGEDRPRHLSAAFDQQLLELKERVRLMGQLVDQQVTEAIDAFGRRDVARAELVIAGDKRINDLEREIDERCVLMLALHQPAASDLRFVAAVLKIVTDLERVGDFAVSIAKSVRSLAPVRLRAEQDLPALIDAALTVLRHALDAFLRRDVAEAEAASTADLPVTASALRVGSELRDDMRREPQLVDNAVALLFVTKHIERIAEHATNVAEMALYTERGEDVRHLVVR